MADYQYDNVEPLVGSSAPTGTTPSFKPVCPEGFRVDERPVRVFGCEEGIVAAATEIIDLAEREEAAHVANYARFVEDPGHDGKDEAAAHLTERLMFKTAVLSLIQADTPSALAAKARAFSCLGKVFDGTSFPEERGLMDSIVQDAIRLGASPASGDDELIAFARKVRDLAIREHQQCVRLSELCDRLEKIGPPEPRNRNREAVDAYIDELQRMEASVEVHTYETAKASLAASQRVREGILAEARAEREKYDADLDAVSRRIGHRAAERLHRRLFRRLKGQARQLTFMPPSTLAGLAAKAEASIAINRSNHDDWTTGLSDMIAREIVILGSKSPAAPPAFLYEAAA